MGGFERDELAKLGVVLGVGQLRRVLPVVEPVGPIDDLGQLGVAGHRRVGRQRLGGADERCVDGQAVGRLGHRPKDTNWATPRLRPFRFDARIVIRRAAEPSSVDPRDHLRGRRGRRLDEGDPDAGVHG
jgi:hypothetical protein